MNGATDYLQWFCLVVTFMGTGWIATVAHNKTRECERLRGGVRFWRKRCEAMELHYIHHHAKRLQRLDAVARRDSPSSPEGKTG